MMQKKRNGPLVVFVALVIVAMGVSLAVWMIGKMPTRSEVPHLYTRPAMNTEGELRVLVYHDMEGLSGQDDWRTFDFSYPEFYQKGQELLVNDVNAVIDGLFAGGATEVHVVDAHGSGNPQPDILSDKLDPRARQVFRDQPFRQYVDLTEPNVYDAVAVVGMHAKTGSKGFASHTFTLGTEIIINGRSITETELIAYSWGRVDVPVVFASGDDQLLDDLKDMNWLEYVVVKEATSASTVNLRPVDEVHAEMREKARRALENLSRSKVMKIVEPVEAALRVVPPADLSVLRDVPGVNYSDNRIDFTAKNFQEAYDGVIGTIRVATRAYPQILREIVSEQPNGEQLLLQYNERLYDRWLDYESGRWQPEQQSSPSTPRKYFGAR